MLVLLSLLSLNTAAEQHDCISMDCDCPAVKFIARDPRHQSKFTSVVWKPLMRLSLTTGRKASMASTKVWSHGDIRLIDMSEATDYGQAVAMTRLGVTGKTRGTGGGVPTCEARYRL